METLNNTAVTEQMTSQQRPEGDGVLATWILGEEHTGDLSLERPTQAPGRKHPGVHRKQQGARMVRAEVSRKREEGDDVREVRDDHTEFCRVLCANSGSL